VVTDQIKKIYIQTKKELTPNSNYYIGLNLSHNHLTFTNRFKKVVIDGLELYELELFATETVIPMNDLSLFGWTYSPANKDNDGTLSVAVDEFTSIYYEKADPFVCNQTNGEMIISYPDSELSRKIRLNMGHVRKLYGSGVDNVLRYMDGMCGVAFDHRFGPNVPFGLIKRI
jgi:hypothetical protein